MIKYILLLASLAVRPAALSATDKPAAQDLLATAAHQADVLGESSKPFLLDVDFTARLDTARAGHLRLRWEAKDRWWMKVTVGPIEFIKFKNGEETYILRNIPFTPTQVNELWSLLHIAKNYDKFVVNKDKRRVENGVRLDCLESEGPPDGSDHPEICVDSSTRDILSYTHEYWGIVHREQFGDFADFAGHRYPRRLELLENRTATITANVMELKEDPFDDKLLVPPEGAIERRECPDLKGAVAISQAAPDFHGADALKGSSKFAVTILADGTVGDVQVMKSGGRVIDGAFGEAIRKSKFKPAMCGAEPVVTDMEIEFTTQTSSY